MNRVPLPAPVRGAPPPAGRGTLAGRLLVLLALWAGAPPGARAEDGPPVLVEGVAQAAELAAGALAWTGRVEVPAEATALHVVAAADQDVDLFLEHGRPLEGAFEGEADWSSRGERQAAVVSVTREDEPSLSDGVWYVHVVPVGGRDRPAHLEVVAFVDRPGGPRTLLPGLEEAHDVELPAAGPQVRTFLPATAAGLVLRWEGLAEDRLRYEARGPKDAVRAGRALERLVLDRAESPAGTWLLTITAEEGDLPERVRAEVLWREGTAPAPPEDHLPVVRPGASVVLTLGGPTGPRSQMVRIPVAAGTAGFQVEAANDAGADVDMYVRRGRPLALGDQDADYFALTCSTHERVLVGGARPLAEGTYYCEVVLVTGEGPVPVRLRVRAYPPRAGRGTWGEREPGPIGPGAWVRGRVRSCLAGLHWYAVEVPAGARSLHALLLDATAPLDLVLARRTDGSIMQRALTPRVDERLDVLFRPPPEGPRHFLLGVMNRNPYEEVVDYRIAIAFDAPPELPSDLLWPPVMDTTRASPRTRAAAATVELTIQDGSGGSGTCVSPRGHILTCRHVLELDQEGGPIQREGVLVAFPRRIDAVPVQSYLARVLYDDRERDLALLEVAEDIFGRPPPADLALPWLALGRSEDLEIGEAVWVLGYPSEGSEASRTPVILTCGSVAGFESRAGRRTWIKTDAWIGLGHSGGSLVNGRFELVGVPAATLGPHESLGLAVPVEQVPEAWTRVVVGAHPAASR